MIDVRFGDSRNLVYELVDKSIDLLVTSPPYYKQRDYNHPDQIGQEKTYEEYLKTLFAIFDVIKLKLKDTGNVFVNIGDKKINGQYCMIPEQFAIGMQKRGWILKDKVIWIHPNPLPSSTTVSLTNAYEPIYRFTKQDKCYFDLNSIREPHKEESIKRACRGNSGEGKYMEQGLHTHLKAKREFIGYDDMYGRLARGELNSLHPLGRNPSNVWSIVNASRGVERGEHTAPFPLELIRKPILAGCPVGGTVIDIFAGTGVVGKFCKENNRNAILFELQEDHKETIEINTQFSDESDDIDIMSMF